MTDLYTRVVIARYSPNNGCNAPDGELLVVCPERPIPVGRERVRHCFSGVIHRNQKAQYGWVGEHSAFSFEEFLDEYLQEQRQDEMVLQHTRVMLAAIAKLKLGTPVGATYALRGVEQRRTALTVHRVLLYGDVA